MLISKDLSTVNRSNNYPNHNWTDDDLYLVDDNSVLGKSIVENFPYLDFVVENNAITGISVYPYIALSSDKTSIKSDGVDTVTITSDVSCSFYDEEGNALLENSTSLQITSTNTGTIRVTAKADKYKPSSIEIEVI